MNSSLRTLCAAVGLVAVFACSPAPVDPPAADRWTELCAEVSCGAGRCVVDHDVAVCICDPGFEANGLKCEAAAEKDPCAPNPCTEFGRTRCQAEGTVALCLCDEGRIEIGGTCVPKTACTPNPCTQPFETVCVVEGGDATCECDPGHAPAEVGCDPNPVFDCDVVHTSGNPDAFEPDECPSKAAELIEGLPPVEHTINPAGDVDFYVLQAEAGHVYEVKAISSSGLALYADAYAADGLTAIGADHSGGTSLAMRFKAPAFGPVFVRLRALRGNDLGAYSVSAEDLGLDDFPDSTATALGVTSNSSFGGALHFGGDVDAFRIPVQGGVAYSVAVKAATATSLRVELIAHDGATVKQQSVGDELRFTTRSTAAGFVYVRISAFEPHLLTAYDVTIISLGPDDHADAPQEATPIPLGATGLMVTLERPDDVDLLTFDAAADHIYSALCTQSGSYVSADIDLLDGNGNVLGQESPGWAITNETLAPGPRFLRISLAYPTQTVGKFSCKVQDLGTDDHGDDVSDATAVTPGSAPAVAKVETSADRDVFSFTPQPNNVYRFTCTMTQGGSCSLKLLGSGGAQITTGTNTLAYEFPSGGTHYFEVSSWSSYSSGSYTYMLEHLGVDDHGDTTGAATSAPMIGQASTGVFETPQDKDLFSFTATAQHIYRVTCTPQSSAGCAVRFLSSAGIPLATSASSYGSATVLATELPSSGTYYVELSVASSYGALGGAYTWVLDDLGVDDHGDDLSSATLIAAGDSGSATLEFSGDVDAFKLVPTVGRVYRFTCTKGTVSACDVRVKDSSGALLAAGTSSSTSGWVSWEASSSSPLVFIVGEGSSYQKPQGTYGWTLTDVGTDDHGDSSSSATALTLPMSATSAQLEGFGDVDVFSVAATAGNVYRFTCTRGTAPGCGIRVKDASGTQLATAQSQSSAPAVVALVAPATATLYFELYDGSYYSTGLGAGSYTYLLEDVGPDDHGNSPSAATAMSVGPSGVAGDIQFSGDKDVFSFSATAGRIYKASCTAAASTLGYCNIAFQNSAGAVLASGNSQAAWKATQSSTFFVEVKSYYGSGTGAYTLAVEDLGVDDHGDTYQTATALPGVGVIGSGTLEVNNDVDYFSISLAASTSYTLTVTNGTYIDTQVYGTNGTSVVANGSPGATFTTTVAGTYYVRLYHWTSSQTSTAYTIKIQ